MGWRYSSVVGLILIVCVFVCVCRYVYIHAGAHEGQKRAWDPLKLTDTEAGTGTQVLCKSNDDPSLPSLKPLVNTWRCCPRCISPIFLTI